MLVYLIFLNHDCSASNQDYTPLRVNKTTPL